MSNSREPFKGRGWKRACSLSNSTTITLYVRYRVPVVCKFARRARVGASAHTRRDKGAYGRLTVPARHTYLMEFRRCAVGAYTRANPDVPAIFNASSSTATTRFFSLPIFASDVNKSTNLFHVQIKLDDNEGFFKKIIEKRSGAEAFGC